MFAETAADKDNADESERDDEQEEHLKHGFQVSKTFSHRMGGAQRWKFEKKGEESGGQHHTAACKQVQETCCLPHTSLWDSLLVVQLMSPSEEIIGTRE